MIHTQLERVRFIRSTGVKGIKALRKEITKRTRTKFVVSVITVPMSASTKSADVINVEKLDI